jgi:hypothetical protein
METFMSHFVVVFILQTFTPCLPTVKKWFRIETTIKHDITCTVGLLCMA